MSCDSAKSGPVTADIMILRVNRRLQGTKKCQMPMPARTILYVLSGHTNSRSGLTFPSQETIAGECGCGVTVVDEYTRALIERGWMTREKFGRNQYRYFLTPEQGRWWDEDALAKSDYRKPPNPVPRQARIPGWRDSRPSDGGTLVPRQAGMNEEGNEERNEEEREAEDVAALLAPSVGEIEAQAPVTSPSPVAVPEVVKAEVKETVQVGQQGTLPGMEAPKAVQKTKRAPRANSGAAKGKTNKVAPTQLSLDFHYGPEHEEKAKEFNYSGIRFLFERFKIHYTSPGAKKSTNWSGEFMKWLVSEAERNSNGRVANQNRPASPMQTVPQANAQRKF